MRKYQRHEAVLFTLTTIIHKFWLDH